MPPSRLIDKLIVGTIHSRLSVDVYPPTTIEVACVLVIDDTKRVNRALYKGLERKS